MFERIIRTSVQHHPYTSLSQVIFNEKTDRGSEGQLVFAEDPQSTHIDGILADSRTFGPISVKWEKYELYLQKSAHKYANMANFTAYWEHVLKSAHDMHPELDEFLGDAD